MEEGENSEEDSGLSGTTTHTYTQPITAQHPLHHRTSCFLIGWHVSVKIMGQDSSAGVGTGVHMGTKMFQWG